MLGQLVKVFIVTILLKVTLFSADLDPKYLRLFTNNEGQGVWQMVGVAGFYNNIYGLEDESNGDGTQEYTHFYCESATSNSIIRTINGPIGNTNDVRSGKNWLFSIQVLNKIVGLSPVVVDIKSSTVNCADTSEFGSSVVTDTTFIYENASAKNSGNAFLKFLDPNNVNSEIVFSLNYSQAKIYRLPLTGASQEIVLDADGFVAITDEDIINNMSVAKQPINEIVDLYLNDNPGFGVSNDGNYTNLSRDSRDFHSANHQVAIDGDANFISKNSELKIFSYDNSKNQWLEYNSKNQESSNEFSELQAGKGYWMKYDFDLSGNYYLKTLDLNSSCGLACQSNFTIATDTSSKDYNFPNSDIDNIILLLNNSNFADVNISAVKTADNSILIIAQASEKPTIKETTVGKSVFLNVSTTKVSFWNTQDIKSGLVLGDSSVVLTSNSVYSTIAQKGWNLLTLPTSTIRKTVTGLIIDWDTTNGFNNLKISDEFGINEISIYDISTNDVASDSKNINKAIQAAKASGELSSELFNVRALPISTDKILFISDDKFVITTTDTFNAVQTLDGNTTDLKNRNILSDDNKIAVSNYGEYALFIEPNLNSQFVKDGNASIEINGKSIRLQEDSTVTTLVTAINNLESITNVKAHHIDADFNASINVIDYILLTSIETISVRDVTYTKVYKHTVNNEGASYIHIVDGTDIFQKNLADILIPKDVNISSSEYSEFNQSVTDSDNHTVEVSTYIVDEDGNGSISDNEVEYLMVSSIDSPNIILRESVPYEHNMTQDTLELVSNYDKNVSSKGAILRGIQGSELASYPILSDGNISFTNVSIKNITANPFISDDLLISNSLLTLSKAFSEDKRYLPTMIIGSESNISTGKIFWKTLSPIQNTNRWYYEYNLFSTNNQKAYWVYLDDFPAENPINIIEEDTAELKKPAIEKTYIRTFNNKNNTTENFFNLKITSAVKGVTEKIDGTIDTNSILVTANLIGVSDALEKLDFRMNMGINSETTAPIFEGTAEFNTEINYYDVDGINNDLKYIKIIATDGRLYTDEYNLIIDVKKPSNPELTFQKGDIISSTKLYINNKVDSPDTVKYLVFKDRINDINGTSFKEDSNIPSNFIMSVEKANGTAGIKELCKNTSFFSENINVVNLVVIALDNEDTKQANFSDMSKISFIPLQGVHVLENTYGEVKDIQPNAYDIDCNPVGELKDSDGNKKDSGVTLKSLLANYTVTLTYKPYDLETSTKLPLTMFVGLIDNETTSIAKITYIDRYDGKNFFVNFNGNIYQGKFLNQADSNLHDTDDKPFILTKIENNGQKIGEIN